MAGKNTLSTSSNNNILPQYRSLLIIIGLIVAIELLDKTVFKIPNPTAIYLTAVVYATFSGGLYSGLISAAITLFDALYYFSTAKTLFHYTQDNLWQLFILGFTTPLIALMVGTLKQRLEQLAKEAESQVNISEQNQREVQDALQKLTFHFENTPLALIERDKEFKIIRWSQAAERIFGWKSEEVIGKSPEELQLVFVEDLESVKNIRYRLLNGIEKNNISSNRSYRKDGSVIDCEWYNSALLDEAGNVVSVLSLVLDVTQRKRAEELLQASHNRNINILESITDAFVAFDLEWRYIYVNEEAARIFQRPREEILGKQLGKDLFTEAIDNIFYREFHRAVDEQIPIEFEGFSEELKIWVEVHLYPITEGLAVYFRDISEQKRIQKTLEVNRDRLDLMLQATELGLWYCDLPFDKLIWNDKCKEHFWLPPDAEVDIDLFYAILHPDDRERTKAAVDLSIQQKTTYDIEYRTVASDGNIRWIRAIGRGFYDASNNPIRFDGITVDITDRKRSEAREQQYIERLQKLAKASVAINSTLSQKEILQLITEQAREIIEAHHSVTRITTDGNWAQAISAISLSDKYAQWREYNEKTNGSGIYSLVCKMQRPMRMTQAELEAHPAWLSFGKHTDKHPPMRGWLAAPLTGRDGKNIGLIQLSDKYEGDFTQEDEAILVQLAGLASAAIDNAKLYEESQQANRLKDEFLATLSHELRSPLNAMLGWLSLLRTRNFDEATKNRALETIERNAKTQAQLIEDILDISRIIRGKLTLKIRPVDLASVISSAIDVVQPAADAKNIQIQAILDPCVGPVSADSERLQQVIWNLLTNAVKFTPKGGSVQICQEIVNSYVEITVSDTGKGIEPDFLPYVFERFRQADSSITRSYGGLGLGLSIVRQVVELHGGTVKAQSEGEGKGATFTVKLPLMAAKKKTNEPEAIYSKMEYKVSQNDSQSLQGVRVLVVDDEADARDLLVSILEECGVEVVAVASAKDAIRILTQQASGLDVLISDIGMPNEDGYSLLRKVRSLSPKSGGKIPAVALTAFASTEDRQAALLAGFEFHLAKPVELNELILVIAKLTGRTVK